VEISTGQTDQGRPIMLWHTSIAAQRLTPRGGVAMTFIGRPGLLTGSENSVLGRWRS
jgi:hypothetical protein